MDQKNFKKLSDMSPESCKWYLQRFEAQHQRMPQKIMSLLNSLIHDKEFSGISQMEHALQSATLAAEAGASDEWVISAFCHDIGKALSQDNHAAISAEFLKPYVGHDCYMVVLTHEIFQGQFYFELIGKDPKTYLKYSHENWFEAALKFNEWDEKAFDPDRKTIALEEMEQILVRHFEKIPYFLKMVIPPA